MDLLALHEYAREVQSAARNWLSSLTPAHLERKRDGTVGVLNLGQVLETVLSAGGLLDTLQGRYCWVRRAQVALAQDDAALAFDIAERLIASAPGLPAGGVLTFPWMLKGEALADTVPDEALKDNFLQRAYNMLTRSL